MQLVHLFFSLLSMTLPSNRLVCYNPTSDALHTFWPLVQVTFESRSVVNLIYRNYTCCEKSVLNALRKLHIIFLYSKNTWPPFLLSYQIASIEVESIFNSVGRYQHVTKESIFILYLIQLKLLIHCQSTKREHLQL